MTTATELPPMPAGVGKMTIAKSFELDARAITAFAAGVDDFNPAYLDDAREGGLIAHPGMVFSWQWNSRHVPDETLPLELVRRSVHAWIDVRFARHPREGDIITCQGKQVAVRQVRSGVLSSQRFAFRDSRGEEIAVMDTGGVTRGAKLDGGDRIIVEPPPLPQRAAAADEPVWSATFDIAPSAPHYYTECADIWNPIHTERKVAMAAGLPDIILHGSANISIALREIVNRSLDGDPSRLQRYACQFRAMVFPGQPVTVQALEEREEDGRKITHFEMRNHKGEIAIANGVAVAAL